MTSFMPNGPEHEAMGLRMETQMMRAPWLRYQPTPLGAPRKPAAEGMCPQETLQETHTFPTI